MPNMANVTVKAANGTTDVVFVAQSPSGGDGIPAIWRIDAEGTNPAVRPSFQLRAGWNGPKTLRRSEALYVHPYAYTDANTGLSLSKSKVSVQITVQVPQDIPDTTADEAVARAVNMAASALIKECFATGFSAT